MHMFRRLLKMKILIHWFEYHCLLALKYDYRNIIGACTLLSSKGKKVNKKERVSTIMGLSLLEDTDNYFHDPNKGPLRRRDRVPW